MSKNVSIVDDFIFSMFCFGYWQGVADAFLPQIVNFNNLTEKEQDAVSQDIEKNYQKILEIMLGSYCNNKIQ